MAPDPSSGTPQPMLPSNALVMAAIAGTAAAVAGMMFSTVWLLVQPQVRTISRVIVLFGGAFLAAWKFRISPVPIIAVAALVGFLWKEKDGNQAQQ